MADSPGPAAGPWIWRLAAAPLSPVAQSAQATRERSPSATTGLGPSVHERSPGMGTKRYRLKIATWTVVREVGVPSPRKLDCPEAVVELARDLLRDQDDDKEHFWLVLLNAQNHYLLAHLVSTGTQSATLVHPREVLGPALREGAAALILIHNHPSGDPAPSREDLRLTRQLVEAAQVVDLKIHDHVIIGNGSGAWVSLATRGLM